MMLSVPPEFAPGVVTLWSGSSLGIPPNWLLCDGTHGTPDLRDKFVVASGPTFTVGNEGGNVSHTHPFTADAHTHDIDDGDSLAETGSHYPSLAAEIVTGTTDSENNLPTYYSLAYIMHE